MGNRDGRQLMTAEKDSTSLVQGGLVQPGAALGLRAAAAVGNRSRCRRDRRRQQHHGLHPSQQASGLYLGGGAWPAATLRGALGDRVREGPL